MTLSSLKQHMGEKMKQGNTIATVTAVTTPNNGVPIDLGDMLDYSISVNFTGSNVVGSLKLQARNTESEDWIDIADTTQAVTASGGHIWSVVNAGYRYVRPVWTYTSGTGNITANYIIKQNKVTGA